MRIALPFAVVVALIAFAFIVVGLAVADKPLPQSEPAAASPPAPVDLTAAKQALAKEARDRQEACTKEVAAALEKHNCTISVGMLVTPKGNVPQFQIVPLSAE